MVRVLLVIPTVYAIGACAFCAEAPEGAMVERIQSLIRQMADDSFERREGAQRELEALGELARKAIAAALEDKDMEVRNRARCVIEKWAKAEAEARRERFNKALDWLAKAQEPDGHWDSLKHGASGEYDLEQTAWALLTYLGAGHTEKVGDYKETVKKAVKWLIAQQRDDGRFGHAKRHDGAVHAVAGLALAEAAGMSSLAPTRTAAQNAVEYALKHQSKNGKQVSGFGSEVGSPEPELHTTTLFVMFLKSAKVAGLRVSPQLFDGAINFLNSVDDRDNRTFSLTPKGPADWKNSVMGTVCRQFLGWKRDELWPYGERVLKDWSPPKDNDTREGFADYLGTLVMFQLGGELWQKYTGDLRARIYRLQQAEGDHKHTWPRGGTGVFSGRVAGTALSCLTLEVWWRYMRYFGKEE